MTPMLRDSTGARPEERFLGRVKRAMGATMYALLAPAVLGAVIIASLLLALFVARIL